MFLVSSERVLFGKLPKSDVNVGSFEMDRVDSFGTDRTGTQIRHE